MTGQAGSGAETLRRAASLMRERAEGATDGGPRWETGPDEMHGPSQMIVYPSDSDSAVAFAGADDAAHIASWHPAVALAAAEAARVDEEWARIQANGWVS